MKQPIEYPERMKLIRQTLNLKQAELAKELNIAPATLSEWESGKYKPDFETIRLLSEKYNISLYYLIHGLGDMFLDPVVKDIMVSDRTHVNKEAFSEFLYYFVNSAVMQYYIMTKYQLISKEEWNNIHTEINRKKGEKEEIAAKQKDLIDSELRKK